MKNLFHFAVDRIRRFTGKINRLRTLNENFHRLIFLRVIDFHVEIAEIFIVFDDFGPIVQNFGEVNCFVIVTNKTDRIALLDDERLGIGQNERQMTGRKKEYRNFYEIHLNERWKSKEKYSIGVKIFRRAKRRELKEKFFGFFFSRRCEKWINDDDSRRVIFNIFLCIPLMKFIFSFFALVEHENWIDDERKKKLSFV